MRSVAVFLPYLLFACLFMARAQAPAVTSFSPTTVCQGEAITITGTNFTDASAVKAGSLDVKSFKVNSATSITAVVDDFATTGKVSVTTPKGTGVSPATLTILPAPRPSLNDIGTLDAPFTNCDGNATYQLKVSNASSAVTGTGNVYKIDWGDNTAPFTQTDWPSGAQTTHTYNAQGYFTIAMTITPANGCTKTITYRFYNGQNPLASFTTTQSTTGLCVPAPIEFQIGNWFNNSAGTTYEINFGDGAPHVTLPHPLNASNTIRLLSHTYNTSSCPNPDYTATLNATNGCFTTTYTLNQIIIRKKPEADFGFQTSPACLDAGVCFVNQTANGYSGNACSTTSTYEWDFGDGTTSTSPVPSCHNYATAGTYTVTLKASNPTCGSSSKTKQVTVLPTSPPPTVSAGPLVYCQGQPASPLTATGTGLLWYTAATGGTGSPAAPIPSTVAPGTRTWYVSQTLANECESPRVAVVVTVNALPAPPVTAPVSLCLSQAAAPLTATGANLLWYTGPTGGTGSSSAPTPSTTAPGTTTYYVSQTVNGCEGPRASMVVTVNTVGTAPQVVSPVNYCQYQTAAPLTATGASLVWYTAPTGGAGSSSAPIPSTTTPGSTTYYVSQLSGCGESPRSAITVNVTASPSASISYAPAALCNVTNSATSPNPPVAVTQTGSPGGAYSVSPATGLPVDPATGQINPSGATAGTYTIKYSVPGTGGCGVFTATATVTINGAPSATLSYASLCTSDAVARPTFSGTTGGTFSSTAGLVINAATGAITPGVSQPGAYTVTYTVQPSPPCPGLVITAQVTLTQAPSAAISYTPATLCNVTNSATTPNPPVAVTQTGSLGGTYSVSPATGLPVDPATGQIDPSGAVAGTYTISYTVAGQGACSNYKATATVVVNSAPAATIGYPGSPFCQGTTVLQKVSLSGTPGGTFSSSAGLSINAATGEINPSGSQPGAYTVTYTIAPSAPCPGFATPATVVIDESPVLSFTQDAQSICSGGTAVFLPHSSVPNTNYAWSVVGALPPDVVGVAAGSVSGVNPSISLTFTNTGANSRTIRIQVAPANPSAHPCPGTPYELTLTIHPIPPAPTAPATELCMGSPAATLSVSAQPGAVIHWYDENLAPLNGPPTISTGAPRQFTYYVNQTNSYGCTSPNGKVMAVVHPTPKIVGSSYTNPVTCGIPSGSIVLSLLDLNDNALPDLPLTVHYDKFQLPYTMAGTTDANGKVTIPLTAGTYSSIYVEAAGCLSGKMPDVFVLRDPSPPASPVAGYNPPLCSESMLNLTALSATSPQTGDIQYVWAGPAFGPYPDTASNTVVTFPSAPVSYEGTYVVYAMQNNCISLPTSFAVMIKQSPSKPVVTTRNPLCVGDDLYLQASSSFPGQDNALTYVWRGPGAGFPVNGPVAGIHSVKVEDGGIYSITVTAPQTGCSVTTDTLIGIGAYPIVKFARDTFTLPTGYLLPLEPVILNAAAPGVLPMQRYEWTPDRDLACNDAACSSPVATIRNDVCYSVNAVNVYGCAGRDTMCVKVFCEHSQIFIPNAFTPQGSIPGNRKLVVRASGIASVRSFRVFNRWGKIVFERNNFPPNSPDYGWDGTVNGRPADPGVYVYTAEVVCENGVPYTYKGNVTLL